MAGDRVVKVTLQAQVSGYLAGMEQARKATQGAGSEAEKAKAKWEQSSAAMSKLGTGLLAFGAAAGVGVGLAIKKFADFDQAMSNVKAATQETAENMQLLRNAALDAGARTVFSATEAANAIEELGKAGIDTDKILSGGLNGALDLASAGGLGVAEAAGIAATALKTFKLEGSDMSHVADLMAAGAGKAMGDVTDLGAALAQSGMVASATGLSIEETTASLAAFASQGLLGSDAGTSLKSMLQALTPASAAAKTAMDKYNLTAYDAQGNFIGMEAYAGKLQAGLKDLSTEQQMATLKTIFGSDAIRAATVLYDEGAEGMARWTNEVDDTGYAAQVAADRLDNLSGDVEALGGSLDTALIQAGSGANDALRFLTQSATEAVDAFGNMPVPAQQAALGVGAVVAAASGGVGIFMTLVPKVVEYKDALAALGPTAQKTGRVVGVAMKGLGALAVTATAIALINQLDSAMQGAEVSTTELANTLNNGSITDALKKAFEGAGTMTDSATNLEEFGDTLDYVAKTWDTRWAGAFGPAFIGWMDGSDVATDTARNGIANLGEALAGMSTDGAQQAMRDLRDQYDLTDEQILTLIHNSGPYKDALITQAEAAGRLADDETLLELALTDSGAAAEANIATLGELAGAAGDATDDIKTLADEVAGFGKSTIDAIGAESSFRQAVDDATAAWGEEGFASTLDLTTQAGRDNTDVLLELAEAANGAAASAYATSGSQDVLRAKLDEGRSALYNQARQFFETDEAAWDYVNTLMSTPEQLTTRIDAETAVAREELRKFLDDLNNIPKQRDMVINQVVKTTGASQGVVGAAYNATGGAISGPGTGTSDSILSWLSNGEHVLTAEDVSRMGGQSAVYRFRERLGSGLPAFANGGLVGKKQTELTNTRTRYDARIQAQRLDADAKYRIYKRDESNSDNKRTFQAAKDGIADLIKARKSAVDALAGQIVDLKREQADYLSDTSRGSNTGMYSAVDQLRGMSRDGTFSGSNQKGFAQAANAADRALGSLSKRAESAATAVEKASDKLDVMKDRAGDLASASAQMAAGIASSLRGAVRPEDAFKAGFTTEDTSKEIWKRKGNLTWAETQVTKGRTVADSVSASGVASFYKGQAGKVSAFAAQLKKLAAKGVNGALLEEIAAMGVDQGGQMATALLSASASQISSINSSYKAIGSSANAAGQTVADANFKKQIEAAEKQIRLAEAQLKSAEKSASAVQAQIKAQTDRIVSIIKSTLGLAGKNATGGTISGIGSGTSDSNLRWLSAGEEVIAAGPASKYRGLLKMINSDRLGAGFPTYVQSSAGRGGSSVAQDAAPVQVLVEFKDAALRQMVDVQVKQADDRNRVMLEVL